MAMAHRFQSALTLSQNAGPIFSFSICAFLMWPPGNMNITTSRMYINLVLMHQNMLYNNHLLVFICWACIIFIFGPILCCFDSITRYLGGIIYSSNFGIHLLSFHALNHPQIVVGDPFQRLHQFVFKFNGPW